MHQDLPETMSRYERETWERLQAYWNRKAKHREAPRWLKEASGKLSKAASKTAEKAGERIPDSVGEQTKKAAEALGEKVLAPTARAAVDLLELVNDWSAELTDPTQVVKFAQKKGLDISDVAELRDASLKDCDRLLTRNTLKWRSLGALEGGGMGALALVPVAGMPASLTADFLVIQVLSTSIASRIAYSYGFDAKDPLEEEFIRKLVNRSFMAQATKAAPLNQVANAAAATAGRKNWSAKLLENHRLLAALKNLMEKAGPAAPRATVGNVSKTLPVIGIVIGAGFNSAVLGAVAADAQRFCQTRFLSEKYGLPMPEVLADPQPVPDGDPEVIDEPGA